MRFRSGGRFVALDCRRTKIRLVSENSLAVYLAKSIKLQTQILVIC
jgi:hypothetical protein